MQTFFILLLSLLAIILQSSCNKDNSYGRMDHTEVKGRLLDASTGEPIEGGTIYLTDGSSWLIADSLGSKANGEYSFKYDHEQYAYAEIWTKAHNYLTNQNIASWSADYPGGGATAREHVRENGRVNHLDIRLPPMGYVKFCFSKTSTDAGNDEAYCFQYSAFTT